MSRPLLTAAQLSAYVGLLCGTWTGLIAALAGSLLTDNLPDLQQVIGAGFLLTALALPFALLRSPAVAALAQTALVVRLASIVLPAITVNLIGFTMPAIMTPLMLHHGVTYETLSGWSADVLDALIGWRLLVVAGGSVLIFSAVSLAGRRR